LHKDYVMSNHIQIVGTFNYKNGQYVTVDKNKQDFNKGLAVPIPASQLKMYYPLRSERQIYTGSGLNRLLLKTGLTYPSTKGNRIIIKVTKDYVIFVKVDGRKHFPHFFIQSCSGFQIDWLDLVRINAAKKLIATEILADWEVQFLVGVVAGSGWKGLSFVIGMDLFEEAVTKTKTKASLEVIRMLQILFTFHLELKQVAPTLSSVITDVVWLSLLKGQEQYLIPAMVHDPKIAARAAGTISAQVGKQVLQSRLTISSLIWSTLSQVGIKAVMTIPTAISDTIGSFNTTDTNTVITKIGEILNTINIVLSDDEKVLIVREIEKNPIRIRKIFGKMLKELKTPPR
jgi:hypothetical protein